MSGKVTWSLTGLVVGGERRGRLIGFPTANIQVSETSTLPPDGIYAGLVRSLDDPALCRAAAISVGSNPTFDGLTRTVEAHLLDFAGDLYGRQLQVQAVRRLRGMTRFPDFQALVDAIAADVAATRVLIGEAYPEVLSAQTGTPGSGDSDCSAGGEPSTVDIDPDDRSGQQGDRGRLGA
jgi:riboflavin kinase/FMN adenylyltransferase